MKRRSIAVFSMITALVTLMCSLCGCNGATDKNGDNDNLASSGADTNEIVVGIAQDPDNSLDPYKMTAAGTREVMFNVFEGLVKPNSDGEFVCAVASDYKVSDDMLTYTFILRENVKFHNGEVCDANDVLYSFKTCAETSVTSAVVAALSDITSINADGNVITVTLGSPNSDFISYAASVYIVPEGYDEQDTRPVGTGPFKFESRSVQENFILVKNEDYYGEKAKLDKVTYRIFADATALFTALNSGALDLVAHLTIEQVESLTNGYNVLEGTMNLVQAIYLNNDSELFKNELVRQALCYAIDKDTLLELTASGHGTKLGSSMYPAFAKYFDDSLSDAYPYDPEKAGELLAQAGYPNGISFKMTVPSNYGPHVDTATVLVEQLKACGINASIELVDWNTWLSEVYGERKFEATVVGFDSSILTASGMLARWVTGNSKNMINYSNEEYDKTYELAQSTADDNERTELYKRCLEILSETAANVYIQDLADFVAIDPELEGYEFYPLYVIDMSKIGYK